jgi:hypothetical protein
MQDKNEIWQVQVNGQIYEATFQELTEWIAERSLLPTDQVRKKDLRWMQADRVPTLQPYFVGGAAQNTQSKQPSHSAPKDIAKEIVPTIPTVNKSFELPAVKFDEQPTVSARIQAKTVQAANFSSRLTLSINSCHFHPEIEAVYVCKNCDEKFCKGCPKAYGAVKICALCGYFCETYQSTETEQVGKGDKSRNASQNSSSNFDIFGTALAYPLKYPLSFLMIGLFYAIALSLGTYLGFLAALILGMIALAVIYGCCSRVINQISTGDSDKNYVLASEDLSLAESVIQPASLGIAVYLITWLPISLVSVLFSSYLGDTTKLLDREMTSQIAPYFLFIVLTFITALWGFFYFPIALTTAGYTQNLKSIINPLVGFNMIRQMGAGFWKAFLMYFILVIAAACLYFVVQIITAPLFAMGLGTLPTIFLNSFVWFYLYLAISCIFGYALFQTRDKLNSKF